jgi:hypothetical protein
MVTSEQVSKAVKKLPEYIRGYGMKQGLKRWCGLVYHRAQPNIEGRSIFEEEWDVCIVLDACRADELEREQPNYEWFSDTGRFSSLGSATWEWLPRLISETPDDVLRQTTYVTANPMSDEFCSESQFDELDEVWRYAWDDDWGTVLPRPVTDRAIYHARRNAPGRLLVHYLQPHVPFLVDEASKGNLAGVTYGVHNVKRGDWGRVIEGELSKETVTSWYRKTLSRVLDDVDLLLSNIDAETAVITADHGEAFGEWGLYGHPANVNLDVLTQVPWVETTATDNEEHQPEQYVRRNSGVGVEKRLEALGYR